MFILNFDIGRIFHNSVATEYLQLTEDNKRGKKDYYLSLIHDSDPTVPVTRADVYDRLVRFSISRNSLNRIKQRAFILENFSSKRVGLSIPGIPYARRSQQVPG